MDIEEDTMKIILNKKEMELPSEMTVAQLIREKQLKRAAVWINGEQLLASQYEAWIIKEGDTVKILRVVAGG